MTLRSDLDEHVASILADPWTARDGQVVPATEDVQLGNDAVKLQGTVLYADMAESTLLVDQHKPHFAAEIYKAYLHCAAKVIRSESGEITAYDGDRIMAVFIGGTKNTSAVRAALKLNWCRTNVINPAIKQQYPDTTYAVKHTVGVDSSALWVARTGVRGANDLVWVGRAANHAAKLCGLGSEYPTWIIGRAANHAAKLCGLGSEYPTWITGTVYDAMRDEVKASNGTAMWEQRLWTAMGKRIVYRSNWAWRVD